MSTISGTSIQNLISGFLSGAVGQGTLTVVDILANMTVALLLALLIFVTYRVSHTGEVYSARFNVSLVMLTLVTTMVMNVIGNNVALSLGMVGGLHAGSQERIPPEERLQTDAETICGIPRYLHQ